MINLYTVKKNNTYTYYNIADASSPASGDTLLAEQTQSPYVLGYSYQYSGSAWVRIEANTDSKILINATIEKTCKALNNFFYTQDYNGISQSSIGDYCLNYPREYYYPYVYNLDSEISYSDYTATATSIDIDFPFIVGDLIHFAEGIRNKNKFSYVTNIDTVLNTVTFDSSNVSTTEAGLWMLSVIPEEVEDIISKMIWYDVYERNVKQTGNIVSESEDNYSVSYNLDGMKIGGLLYPAGITNGLKSYKIVKFRN